MKKKKEKKKKEKKKNRKQHNKEYVNTSPEINKQQETVQMLPTLKRSTKENGRTQNSSKPTTPLK